MIARVDNPQLAWRTIDPKQLQWHPPPTPGGQNAGENSAGQGSGQRRPPLRGDRGHRCRRGQAGRGGASTVGHHRPGWSQPASCSGPPPPREAPLSSSFGRRGGELAQHNTGGKKVGGFGTRRYKAAVQDPRRRGPPPTQTQPGGGPTLAQREWSGPPPHRLEASLSKTNTSSVP